MTAHDHKAVSEALERMQLGVNELRQKCKSGGDDCEICDKHQQAHDTIRAELEKLRQRCEELEADARIGRVVFRFIDRMNDVCEDIDPAENILAEFVTAVEPEIMAAIDRAGGGDRENGDG
jgi:hypothetical protein